MTEIGMKILRAGIWHFVKPNLKIFYWFQHFYQIKPPVWLWLSEVFFWICVSHKIPHAILFYVVPSAENIPQFS